MNDIIERVAVAMFKADCAVRENLSTEEMYRNCARAAIEALREPSIRQHIAAMEFAMAHMKEHGVTGLSPFEDYPPLRETTAGMYRAMIDAALSPSDVGREREPQ